MLEFVYVFLLAFLLTLFETIIPMNKKCHPEDFGFKITKPITQYLKNNLNLNNNLALINSLIQILFLIYIIVQYLLGNIPLLYKSLILLTYRQICGFITKMPIPDDFKELESDQDIPPKNHNFFFHYSGHTFILVLIGLDMITRYNKQKTTLIITFTTLYILQTLRLLATRGHYSIDISNATVLAYLVHHSKFFNL
jgi:hypothetical protein